MNWALIPAAGSGTRMEREENKLLIEVCEKPILTYTLEAFAEHKDIDEIVILVRRDDLHAIETIARKLESSKPIRCVLGGDTRQESVTAGVNFIRDQLKEKGEEIEKPEVIVIHNGANPLVSEDEISQSVAMAKEHGAAVVGREVVDTLKKISGDEVLGTMPRKDIVAVQTPQAIRYDVLMRALDHAAMNSLEVTDDVSLVEELGETIKLVEASPLNFKITKACDLDYFQFLITHYGFPCRYRTGQSSIQREHQGIEDRRTAPASRESARR